MSMGREKMIWGREKCKNGREKKWFASTPLLAPTERAHVQESEREFDGLFNLLPKQYPGGVNLDCWTRMLIFSKYKS